MNTKEKLTNWNRSNRALLEQSPNYRALSVRDLLEARDQYHYHLMNKANVVGTAIGLYLFKKVMSPTHHQTKRPKSSGGSTTP